MAAVILTENIVLSRTRSHDLKDVRKLNCWNFELTDVSMVRRMPSVQVLSLSLNKIKTLADFAFCPQLEELYLRKNEIFDINELYYLTGLPKLRKLWLAENPCADYPNYRNTVLKALPDLEILDNVPVHDDEVRRADELGDEIYDPDEKNRVAPVESESAVESDDQVFTENEVENEYNSGDFEHSKVTNVPVHHGNGRANDLVTTADSYNKESYENGKESPFQPSDAVVYERLSRSHSSKSQYSKSTPTNCIKRSTSINEHGEDYSSSSNHHQHHHYQQHANHNYSNNNNNNNNGQNRHSISTVNYSESTPVAHGNDSSHLYRQNSGLKFANKQNFSSNTSLNSNSNSNSAVYSQKMYLPKGGKIRNSNLLSAVLCLIKELDYASLEVVETEIHCRMEDLGE